MTRWHPVPLFVAVPAGTSRNAFSKPLTADYRISEILMDFPTGTNLGLQYRFFLIATPPANNTVVPSYLELVGDEVQPGNFAGDGISRSIPFQFVIPENAKIFCMVATNTTAIACNAACVAIVERKP